HNNNEFARVGGGVMLPGGAIPPPPRPRRPPPYPSPEHLESNMNQQELRLVRDHYVFGHSTAEYERLRRQGQTFELVTRRLFHAIGLRPGWRCLDLGCGPGEIMRL